MTDLLYALVATLVLGLVITVPVRVRGNGRHVSRPLGRRLGWTRIQVHAVQVVFLLVTVGVSLVWSLPAAIGQGVFIAWIVDDWLTGDNDKPGRKHEWAKVRLRMPKPVKLRPAERWAPVPA